MKIIAYFLLALLATGLVIYFAKQVGQKPINLNTINFNPSALYKIVTSEGYNPIQTANCITLTALDLKDGFIHTSFGNQVHDILKKFFKGQRRVVVVELDRTALLKNGTKVKEEQNKPGGTIFPHLYGNQQIPKSAIVSVIYCTEQSDGSWKQEQ